MALLVTTDWLAGELGAPDLRIMDATLIAEEGPGSAAKFEAAHIPGAVFMNLRALVDTGNPIPNMLPPADKFAEWMQALGVNEFDRIVLYDDSPYRSATRAWWMLDHFGAREVVILDGGWGKWRAEQRPVVSGRPTSRAGHFTVKKNVVSVRTLEQLRRNLASDAEQVVDARSAGRFTGEEAEAWPGLAPGHIPGSRNLPFARMFNADGTWKDSTGLRQAFEDAGVALNRPIVTTCGGGTTASVILFAARLLGNDNVALYDGSWCEWGADHATPKATGPA